jgi:hypothetical protein
MLILVTLLALLVLDILALRYGVDSRKYSADTDGRNYSRAQI